MQALVDALNAMPLAGLMLVVALGFTIGRLGWRGMALGPAGGTLAVALLFGVGGLDLAALYGTDEPTLTVGAFGFALFIYSVGFEAGPRLLTSLRSGGGWRFVLVGAAACGLALAAAIGLGHALALGPAVTAGVLAGALTSAPTYAAAAEVVSDATGLSVAFAVTYPVGLVTLVLLVNFLPRLLRRRIDVEEEDGEGPGPRGSPELTRAFEVLHDAVLDHTLAELDLPHRTGCYITMLHRGSEVLVPHADTRLERGDHVLVRGRLESLHRFRDLVGTEVYDEELRNRMPTPRGIVLTRADVAGRTLGEADIARRFGVLVTSIQRGAVRVDATAEVTLEQGDVLRVVGRRGDVKHAARALGRLERPTHETDIAVYAGGIFLGLLIGRLHLRSGGFDLTFGTAGGLLLAGVLMGRLRNLTWFHADVPPAARQLVRDLGILLFVAETGVHAGASMTGAYAALVWPMLLGTFLVTLLAVGGAVLVGQTVLRLRPVDAWGSVCGGMTSSAALTALRREADSNAPAVSYAASYAVASVLVTLAGQVVVWVMG